MGIRGTPLVLGSAVSFLDPWGQESSYNKPHGQKVGACFVRTPGEGGIWESLARWKEKRGIKQEELRLGRLGES